MMMATRFLQLNIALFLIIVYIHPTFARDDFAMTSDMNTIPSKIESNDAQKAFEVIQSIVEEHPHNMLIQQQASALLDIISNTNRQQRIANEIEKAYQEIQGILNFEITREGSDLANGFPEPGPLGEIQIKEYPKYRMAVAEKGWFQFSTFYTLFNHIQNNDIAMTIPVEMKYEEQPNDVDNVDMGFIYENPDTGKPQKDGSVVVRDFPPIKVVTVGLKGSRNDSDIHSAAKTLKQWLNVIHPEYEIAGKLRVMAYNSPRIPREKNYYEVQYPIVELEK